MNKHRGSDFNQFLIEQELTNTDQPMTPTPRTDEAADRFPQPGQPPGVQWPEIVPAEFARQLERELAAASDQLAANHEATNLMGKWLEQERELADRLGRWMEDHRKNWQWHKVDESCGCEDCVFLVPFDEALAAWRECRK